MTTKPAWTDCRMIGNPYYMAVCLTEEAFRRVLRKLDVPREQWMPWIRTPQSHATCHFLESPGKQCVVVCMQDWQGRNPIEVTGLLVHEAVHIWQAVCDFIGEHSPSAEFEAYSVQAIAQDLMQGFIDAGGSQP